MLAGLLAMALPATAGAATATDYHPAGASRDFATSAGGWEGSTVNEGTCVEQITCPAIANTWVASGGTQGSADGHLRTAISNLVGAESISNGIWLSPSFQYRGADGKQPTDVSFELARRADLTALLAHTGSSASYSVELVELATGVGRTLVDDQPLGTVDGWSRTRQVTVQPSSLVIGTRYRIRITSTFTTAARVFRDSYVDYDDVVLSAVREAGAGGGGTGGGGGGTGGNGGNGAGGGNGGALLDGNRLFLKLKCLGVSKKGRCKVRAVAYAGKKGARMTFPIERRVNSKKGKKVALRIRPRFVRSLADKKKVLVRSQVKAGDSRKTTFKRYRLIKAR